MALPTWDRTRLAASLIGLAIAAYLSVLHYDTAIPLVCSTSGTVNCERVLSSPEASWQGIPVALWGVGWFAVAAVLAILSLARRGTPEPSWLRRAGLGWTMIGAASVVWFLYTELVVIGNICAWCTVVHVVIIGLFAIQVLTDPLRAPNSQDR
jgi:uncharacterized membrane protein